MPLHFSLPLEEVRLQEVGGRITSGASDREQRRERLSRVGERVKKLAPHYHLSLPPSPLTPPIKGGGINFSPHTPDTPLPYSVH